MVIIILLGVIAFSLYKIVPYYYSLYKAKNQYQTITKKVVKLGDISKKTRKQNPGWWYQNIKIDFKKLQAEGKDVNAWIRFDDTETIRVNYPVVYSGDDTTYLHADLYRRYSFPGTLFIEAKNRPNWKDQNYIIFGHNMRNLSMFGSLKKLQQADIYKKNQYFTIYRPNGAYRYRIFSAFTTNENSKVYSVYASKGDNYTAYLNYLKSGSDISSSVKVTGSSKIVTLSTCTSAGDSYRYTVHGVLVAKHIYNR